ncbi:S8 family peptidase [bacterium]|nr:MAG: S8 family peptidase [bacterium]
MNNVLVLKGEFDQTPYDGKGGGRNMPNKKPPVTTQRMIELIADLREVLSFWENDSVLNHCLIDAHHIGVTAKSNRIHDLLCTVGDVSNFVVGARFKGTENEKRKHVITYYVSRDALNKSIARIEKCMALLEAEFGGSINHDEISELKANAKYFKKHDITKTCFINIIVDAYYLESFGVPNNSKQASDQSIITVYKTDNVELIDLMKDVGINVQAGNIFNETTLLLRPEQLSKLIENAPYLIAMEVTDISDLSYDAVVEESENETRALIPSPTNEPTIGVIDTMFDENAYFSEWVEFHNMITLPIDSKDRTHGTAVSSIIVDGPTINPDLDDGCGRFKVRHFGVMKHGRFSSFSVMNSIRTIVEQNPDIKVWNLSLGSTLEINQNSISPEAAYLDQIQYEKDIIFVIAGTNKVSDDPSVTERIGSPADSINAIVVNSVRRSGEPASYTRTGQVLSFYNKPDVSSYGGDDGELMQVSNPFHARRGGTSYAAPWVTRKIAYLIEILGYSREVAKALIVDAAAGWENYGNNNQIAPLIGHGIVPIRIEDILRSEDDEIKFMISGISEEWNTSIYNLPVPVTDGKHPFAAKATLCYFPMCSINQGVDYTNTELDFYVGRFDGKDIKSISKNVQNVNDGTKHYVDEKDARGIHRKWDNTKHVSDLRPQNIRAKEAFGSGMWGICVKTTERLSTQYGKGLKFGVVVTLKEINGQNRINEFIRMCRFQGLLVNPVNLQTSVDIYNKAQETIEIDT